MSIDKMFEKSAEIHAEDQKSKSTNQEKIDTWLKSTVSDLFMDFCYYARKEDDEMSVDDLRELMDNGSISKEKMIKVFTDQINQEYD